MKVLACPGQGSQSQGFLKTWSEEIEGFSEKLAEYSNFCNMDLLSLGSTADEETIKDTEVAQPLIVAASLAAARTAIDLEQFEGVVGHSVGEFAASAIAGVISDEQAMRLVTIRGAAMAKAAKQSSTSMAAVLGSDEDLIAAAVSELGLTIANFNGAGQFVAAGPKDSILNLVSNPPTGTRVIELKVAGAFHTPFMSPAVQELESAANSITASNPIRKLWSNVDGELVGDGPEMLKSLVSQVANPVRWDKCMKSLAGIEMFVELPPAGALAGLAKRGIEGAVSIALKNPSDLGKLV
jgi:[acyl-carrier-protein] S-malonyltransferase